MKVTDVARAAGLNRKAVTLLYKETANQVELDTVEKLCSLFKCKVGDLSELIEEKN